MSCMYCQYWYVLVRTQISYLKVFVCICIIKIVCMVSLGYEPQKCIL